MVLCFKPDPAFQPAEVAHILEKALDATAISIPLLKHVVVSIRQPSGTERHGTRQEDVKLLTVKGLTGDLWDYNTIRSRGFPAFAFDGNVLHRTGIFVDPASPVPTFLAQANFVPGGLLLGLSIWHGTFDGTAITFILRIWAQNCQALQEPIRTAVIDRTLSPNIFDTSRLSASGVFKEATIADHPELIILPEKPTEMPPIMTKVIGTQIFHFTPSALANLKEAASPRNASYQQMDYTWTSSNIALSALVWRSIMIATYHNEKPAPGAVSTFCSPLNACKRMDPALEPDLVASAWCFQSSRLPMASLLSSEYNLADTALVVREATNKINADYIDSLIGMIDGVRDPSLLVPLAFTDVLRTSTLLTSWATFPIYDFDWGEKLGGRCERVRTVASGMFNGMAVVLPELPKDLGGGLEVVIGGEVHVLEALRRDPTWTKYASWK